MGVILNLQFLVKRLEYDRYFIEKSVHRLLIILSSHHTRSHLHISIPLLSLIKTKQTAIVRNMTKVANFDQKESILCL